LVFRFLFVFMNSIIWELIFYVRTPLSIK